MDAMSQPIITIVGEQVALGPLSRDYLPSFRRWFNDLEVMMTYSPRWSPMHEDDVVKWYEGMCEDKQTVAFMVFRCDDFVALGYAALININHYHQTADFDIILGEKSQWGKGLGTEATRLVLGYAFNVLNLHSVMLTVREFNARGLRAYERAGFRAFGRRRGARFVGGKRYDVIYMECLAGEFESPVFHRFLPDGG